MLLTLTFITGLLSSSVLVASNVTQFDWSSTEAVYAFGDSYTFVQGTLGHANFSFIKDYLDLSFTREELLTNEIIANITSTEGANWVEFLTGCFSGRPLSCKTQLWDFAFAGADIDERLLPPHRDWVTPMVEQVQQYLDYGYEYLPRPDGRTLVVWFIGINDTNDIKSNSSITNYEDFCNQEMAAYFNSVQKLYDAGLTAHLFMNVPPGRPTADADDSLKMLFNDILAEYAQEFSLSNPNATVVTFDTFSFFNKILASPIEYGFRDSTSYCTCKDPGYFWYNVGHPTELVHRLLAEEVDTTLRNISQK